MVRISSKTLQYTLFTVALLLAATMAVQIQQLHFRFSPLDPSLVLTKERPSTEERGSVIISSSPFREEISKSLGILCKPIPSSPSLPILIFVVGPQGSGSVNISNALSGLGEIAKLPLVIQQILWEIWEPSLDEERRAQRTNDLRDQFHHLSQKPTSRHYFLQFGSDAEFTFPFGAPHHPLRKPDLLEFAQLAEPFFDLRILVVIREPKEMLRSWISQLRWTEETCTQEVRIPLQRPDLFTSWPLGRCGHVHYHLRVLEDSLVTLSAQLRTLSTQYYRVVNLQPFTTAEALGKQVARFLELKNSEEYVARLKRELGDLNNPGAGNLTPQQNRLVSQILTGSRALLWKSLLNQEIKIEATEPPQEVKCFQKIEGVQ